jgi:hypothetical protein
MDIIKLWHVQDMDTYNGLLLAAYSRLVVSGSALCLSDRNLKDRWNKCNWRKNDPEIETDKSLTSPHPTIFEPHLYPPNWPSGSSEVPLS